MIQCVAAPALALPTGGVLSFLDDEFLVVDRIELVLRQTRIMGGVLRGEMLSPWADSFRFTLLVLDNNGLTAIEINTLASAVDLTTLVISNQRDLSFATDELGLPLSLTSLTLENVNVLDVAFRPDNPATRGRGRRQTQTQPQSLQNLETLVLSNVGLEGVVAVATWFSNGACVLQSLSLTGNNLTAVTTSGCSTLALLDLSDNTHLDCAVSELNNLRPQVRGTLCTFPDANCTVPVSDIARAAQLWATTDREVFVTAGQNIDQSPTWTAFQRNVLDHINVGAADSVVSASVINATCPIVAVVYTVRAYTTTDRSDSVVVDQIDGVDLVDGKIRVTGSPRFRETLAVGNATSYTVDVALSESGQNFSIGTFGITVAPILQSRSRPRRIAYVGEQTSIPPVVECIGGRDTRYRVRANTSIPPGTELDTWSGFLRGVILHTPADQSNLGSQLGALAAGSVSSIVWPIHLVCIDRNEVVRTLPPSDLVIKPSFVYECPTAPVNLNRIADNVVPAQNLFAETDTLWFTAEDIGTMQMPPGLFLSGEGGRLFGSKCLPIRAQLLIRVSHEDASTNCIVDVRIHENSGTSGCPTNAVYHDTTDNAYDGVFMCSCADVDDRWLVDAVADPGMCATQRTCSVSDQSNAGNSDREKTIVWIAGVVVLALLVLVAVLVYCLRRRRLIARSAAKKNKWLCDSPAMHLEMLPGDLDVKAQLGAGHFGVVTVVDVQRSHNSRATTERRDDDRMPPTTGAYACKRCARDDTTNSDRADFVEEITISVAMNHKNVLRTVGIITQCGAENLCMLTELCSAGDLHQFLRARQPNNLGKGVSQIGMLQFSLAAAEGLEYVAMLAF
jgi:hypothetical protein